MSIANLIPLLFYFLAFAVPLVLFPLTSEIFEFNKMVVVYLSTILICTSWVIKMIFAGKVLFRKSVLDLPLVLFILSQFFSTIISIDHRTSLLGYYSRFNGGLLSTVCYSLLYWAYVSNISPKENIRFIKMLITSTSLAAFWGFLEHFGIDKNIWVQDVQSRVFSTFGQPNWFATWLAALIPPTLSLLIVVYPEKKDVFFKHRPQYLLLSGLFLITLLFTKSRSGLLGFSLGMVVFVSGSLFSFTKLFSHIQITKTRILSSLVVPFLTLLVIPLITGTPWTPSIGNLLTKKPQPIYTQTLPSGTVLEIGGSRSDVIRKIVWQGALDIWKSKPLLGTGVETFAFSYYNFRPIEHNLVTEWDFLYNKAHNEYLNLAANSGSLGLVTNLVLLTLSIILIVKNALKSKINQAIFNWALLGGYLSILVSNFFGFSTVPISLLTFLFPALSLCINPSPDTYNLKSINRPNNQKILSSVVLLISMLLISRTTRYWYADTLFAKGKQLNDLGSPVEAREVLVKAIKLSPNEAIFWDELSESDAVIAATLFENGNRETALEYAESAIGQSDQAQKLSPRNLNILRNRTAHFIRLSYLDPVYLKEADHTLDRAILLAPTDAKLMYNKGLMYIRKGDTQTAIDTLKQATRMKPNYKEPRLALGLTFIQLKKYQEAKEEFSYILNKIDPDDKTSKEKLEEIESLN